MKNNNKKSLLSQEEKRIILHELNNTRPEYPRHKTMHRLFAEQVERTPDHIALVGQIPGPGNTFHQVHLSYRELNKKSNRLAHFLCQQGVKENEFIGIMMERDPEMIIGILAILKAGCAYVPLNPRVPPTRTKYFLEECRIHLVLTLTGLSQSQKNPAAPPVHDPEPAAAYLYIDRHDPYTGMPEENPAVKALPGDFAYVIFTSGSTGTPKGVPITHANISPLLHWGLSYLDLNSGEVDRTLQNLAYYFDWSVSEIMITLTTGAALYIAPDDVLLNPGACIAFIQKHAVTVLHATPTQCRHLLEGEPRLDTLKFLFIGAEKLSHELLKKVYESITGRCRTFSMYGPTEATIMATALELPPRPGQEEQQPDELASVPVPIGKAMVNTRLLVLDEDFNPCPANKPGELYILGDGLSWGYLNNPELTAEKFTHDLWDFTDLRAKKALPGVPPPWTRRRLYKTGDLVHWLPDGNLQFIDRIDRQIKIRGIRIELGEIESQISKHPGVKDALVDAREKPAGEIVLCAYIVPGNDKALLQQNTVSTILKQYLSPILPDYMIPAFYMLIDRIPLNPNGKVDKKALPAPGTAKTARTSAEPGNAVEKKLAKIWSQLLGIERHCIGIADNFLDLGGHSLKAAQMSARIHEEFEVKITLGKIFAAPSLKALSRYIQQAGKTEFKSIRPTEKREYYALSPAQTRFFFLYQLDPQSTAYHISDVFSLEGNVDLVRLENAIRQLIRRHNSLRTSFPVVGKNPVQKIHDRPDFSIRLHQEDGREMAAIALDFIRPFDLSQAPLLRIGRVTLAGNKHLLLFDMHHIISDLLSIELVAREFMLIYEGQQEALPPLKLQYKDYSQWQGHLVASGEIKKQEAYWLKEFARDSGVPVLKIPTDYERPALQGFEGDVIWFELSPEETTRLKEYAQEEDTTMFVVMLTLFYIFLAKLGGQEDIVVGTPVAGRRYSELNNIIGLFINTLALRNYPKRDTGFDQFLRDTRKKTLDAFDNQDYQFEDLVKKVRVNRDKDNLRNPIYDVLFTYRWQSGDIFGTAAAGLQRVEWKPRQAMLDLSLVAGEQHNHPQLFVTFIYSTALFKKETVRRFANHFKEIVSAVVKNKRTPINEIKISHDLGEARPHIPKIDFGF